MIKILLSSVVFVLAQVVAFYLAEAASKVAFIFPLYYIFGEQYSSVMTHALFGLIAVVAALYSIPITKQEVGE